MATLRNVKSMPPRQLRELIGLSRAEVAVGAGVGMGSVRIYELDPRALTTSKRQALDDFFARLRHEVLSAHMPLTSHVA